MVVHKLAVRLKELKKVYKKFANQDGYFTFDKSAMKMFEMDQEKTDTQPQTVIAAGQQSASDHFWSPLTAQDLRSAFVQCMMTVVDECRKADKYDYILLPEFYEWVGRIAIRFNDLIESHYPFRHQQVEWFLDRLLLRLLPPKKEKNEFDD